MVLGELSYRDLQRLRAAVKRTKMKFYPTEHCTDAEADKMIEAIGPKTAEKLIKALVDSRQG